MSTIEKSELKRVIAAVKGGKIATVGGPDGFKRRPASKNRRAAVRMVESVAGKAGLDLDKVSGLLAADQKALRGAFDKRRAVAARNFRAAEKVFRSGIAARFEALKLLQVPFASSFITLDKPFLIWQLPNPQLDIFIDSQIASMNSSVRVLVNINEGSNSTRFVFFYLWRNDSDFFAVANVASSLIVNGACLVGAAAGVFSGDRATLNAAASLSIIRWSGWGNDPVTGESNDQKPHPNVQATQRRQVAFLEAEGGHIFQSGDFEDQSFSFEPFPVSHSLLVVPGNAVVLFHVALELSYGIDGGLTIPDQVFVDFSESGNGVFCPNLELEILTPLPALVSP